MRSNHTLELGTGIFVLLGIAALLFLTTQLPSSGLKLRPVKTGYHVTAAFDNIGDLKTGSPVTMAGVRIGDVSAIRIDPRQYKAVVTMRLDPQYNQIPDDSDASIQTEGLLGGKYVGIGPGGSESYLKDGSTIEFTQSALVLENLVNKFFANVAGGKSDAGGGSSNAAPAGGGAAGTESDSNQSTGKPKGKPAPKESPK
jgi:phospholipid/cholesterol/gamma-HCH transport system substrate-binding protein